MKPFPRFYKYADQIRYTENRSHRRFPNGRPTGCTIHYTADRDADRLINSLKKQGLNYHIIIDDTGKAIQTCDFQKAVYHAGRAVWKNNSPNYSHIAVAVTSWGWLEATDSGFKTWVGTIVPAEFVRIVQRSGFKYWDRCNSDQEMGLWRFLYWCVDNGIEPINFCGHDEAAIPVGRKADPGGVLTNSMDEIRAQLNEHML